MLTSWIYMSFYRFKNNIYFFDRRGTDPSILHYDTTVCELLISAKCPQGWLGRGSWQLPYSANMRNFQIYQLQFCQMDRKRSRRERLLFKILLKKRQTKDFGRYQQGLVQPYLLITCRPLIVFLIHGFKTSSEFQFYLFFYTVQLEDITLVQLFCLSTLNYY